MRIFENIYDEWSRREKVDGPYHNYLHYIFLCMHSFDECPHFKIKKWTISAKDTFPNEKEPIKGFSEASRQHVLGLVCDRSIDVLRYSVKLDNGINLSR